MGGHLDRDGHPFSVSRVSVDLLFHLHVHVVHRFDDDHFAMPDPAVAMPDPAVSELPRDERRRQADGLARALSPPR
jgi:hypothetical protein